MYARIQIIMDSIVGSGQIHKNYDCLGENSQKRGYLFSTLSLRIPTICKIVELIIDIAHRLSTIGVVHVPLIPGENKRDARENLTPYMASADMSEIGWLVLGFLVSTVIFGYRAYIAWFFPDSHWEHLYYWSSFYEGRSKIGESWWQTKMQFWIMRVAYTMGFLISVIGAFALMFGRR